MQPRETGIIALETTKKQDSAELLGRKTEFDEQICNISAKFTEQIAILKLDVDREMTEQRIMTDAAVAEAILNEKAYSEEAAAKVRIQADTSQKEHDEELARVKAEMDESVTALTGQIAKLKKEALEKKKNYEEQLATVMSQAQEETGKVKAQAQEKENELTDQICQIKTQAEERHASFVEQIQEINSHADQAIARQKAESESQSSENEKYCAEQIAQLNAEINENRKAHQEQLIQVSSQADEQTVRAKAEEITKQITEQLHQIRAEVIENQQSHEELINKIKAEAQKKQNSYAAEIEKIKAEAEEAIVENEKSAVTGVSETLQKMAQSQAYLIGEQASRILAICSEDIMQKELVWGSTTDSVQHTLTQMKQQHVNYVMVGTKGALEGIVSKSDLNGAISPYLRPLFVKWRRPLDDATLQIKVKWIMSRPVHVVRPETSLTDIMENMFRLGVHALPVVSQQDEVLGMVTEDDVFKAILELNSSPKAKEPDDSQPVQSEFIRPIVTMRTPPKKAKQSTLVNA